ncbi:AraC family transcriptional regulator [Hylemonella gracilis str. Niagara R]|uniref:AraC family transcriptional regulator n=1 Tax=Hylemonella gracilis str. Niagara R TaxID=1458275 RepID=A0A016XC74_9BURK|nr:AraC family transcriptional regulator [Hylemonella gracilis]EYC49699.1 AraC family transcriptional regulator [Hylemonella gracilis str. Niagara R]
MSSPAALPVSLRDYGPSHGSHAHQHHQLLVGLEGLLELEIEGRGQRVAVGDAVLISPGDRHDFESPRGSRCLVLDSAHPAWATCTAQPHRPAQVAALAQYLAQAWPQPVALGHAPALLLEAWRAPNAAQRPRRAIDWLALSHWVQARLDNPLGVTDLAQQVHLSPSQFAARCQEAQGMGPLAWLRSLRLSHARALRDAGWSVQDTARRTGYRSPSALTAALRRAGF